MNIRPATTCVKRRRQNLSDGRGPTCGRASQSGASTPGRNPHRTRRQRDDRRGRGLWRGARRALAGRRGSLLSRRHGAQRGDVRSARPALRVSQPRHPCLRERGVRNRRACGSRPASRRRRRERARRRASPTRGVNPVSGPWRVDRGISARPWESLWPTTGSTCSMRTARCASNSTTLLRRASGPRVGVSQAADRPWRLWLAGRPEVSAYRRSPRAPAPGASD